MSKDYKQLAIQYHLAYMNLKQRIDLSQRAFNTIDFKVQLEVYYQQKLKSVIDKYEDHKYDEVFQYIITNCSNKYQAQEQLITDMKNAREEFSKNINNYQQQFLNLHDKKEKSINKLKLAQQKLVQSQSFYVSITKVFERNVLTIELVNNNVDQKLGHMKTIQDLMKNKENTFGNYKIAVEKFNQQYNEILPEMELFVNQIKELESNVAECIRQLFQKIALAEVSALRNRQYDLDQVIKYLDKVDFTKINTVFKFTDEAYAPAKVEQFQTFSTKIVNNYLHKFNFVGQDEKNLQDQEQQQQEETLLQEQKQKIEEFSTTLQNKQDLSEKLINSIEQSINQNTAYTILHSLSQLIKAPVSIGKRNLQMIQSLFNKLLDFIPKEGPNIHKIQKLSTFIYSQQEEVISLFQILCQNPIFSKKTDYWEWLIFWQVNQTCEGVEDSDRQLIIFQQFQNTVQQMVQAKIPVQIINTFTSDLAPYYGLKAQQIEEIKKLLSKFILAQQSNPSSKLQIQSFDSVE
ncbi:unnamed protein product [Paramecium pentaurelia]|uniref:Uncharacterized protein n=1 Tax=Paramecium pentaurelia TaxID=43138 RepID=A0A8S1SEC7_9CILI|nr:unnamed protein product [Paramecium pentaurelia]